MPKYVSEFARQSRNNRIYTKNCERKQNMEKAYSTYLEKHTLTALPSKLPAAVEVKDLFIGDILYSSNPTVHFFKVLYISSKSIYVEEFNRGYDHEGAKSMIMWGMSLYTKTDTSLGFRKLGNNWDGKTVRVARVQLKKWDGVSVRVSTSF